MSRYRRPTGPRQTRRSVPDSRQRGRHWSWAGKTDDPMRPTFFATPEAFRRWLKMCHATKTELLVGFYKRGTGRPSITWPESVDEALCFGWIRRCSSPDERRGLHHPIHPTATEEHLERRQCGSRCGAREDGKDDCGWSARLCRAHGRTNRRLCVRAPQCGQADAGRRENATCEFRCGRLLRGSAAVVPAHGHPLGGQPQAQADSGPPLGPAHSPQRGTPHNPSADPARPQDADERNARQLRRHVALMRGINVEPRWSRALRPSCVQWQARIPSYALARMPPSRGVRMPGFSVRRKCVTMCT